MVCNTLWAIWLTRNANVFEGKEINPMQTVRKAHQFTTTTTTLPPGLGPSRILERVVIPDGTACVLIDGSWYQQGRAELGIVIYDPGGHIRLIQAIPAVDPFHAEIQALQQLIHLVQDRNCPIDCTKFFILSDCALLVKCIGSGLVHDIPTWQIAEQVIECADRVRRMRGRIEVHKAPREMVRPAHILANKARSQGTSINRYPTEQDCLQENIPTSLDANLFQESTPTNQE